MARCSSRSSSAPHREQERQPSSSPTRRNDSLERVHEQPQPTEEEQEQTPERLAEEEPERDARSGDDGSEEEPIHEA